MSTARSISIIVVQLDEGDRPEVHVSVGIHPDQMRAMTVRFSIDPPQDVADHQDWARQIAAAVCEAL